ncbi:MAG: tetratricopeptide repeat protein [Candidatus Odinarchaeota archaeon]
MENLDETLRAVDNHLKSSPGDASAWNTKGVLHAQKQEWGEALRCLDQAIRLNPNLTPAHSNRGRILLSIGPEKADEALKAFENAQKLNPDDFEILRDKAVALRVLGRSEDELDCYRRLSESVKNEWGIWLRIGDLQLELGDFKHADQSYKTALELKDDLVPAFIRRAIALAMSDQHSDALKSAETATKLEPENAEAWLILGDVNLRAGKHKSAMKCLKKASEIDPTNASVENTMGMVAYKDGKLDDAVTHLRRALIRKRQYPTAMRNLGFILMEQEEWNEAIRIFNDLTGLVKDDPDIFDAKATAFARMDDYCNAEEAWEKARKLYKSRGDDREAERVTVLGRAARINCSKLKKAAKAQREDEKLTRRLSDRHEFRRKKR